MLLARRRQPGRFLLVAAAVPLAFAGLLGAEEGALIPYAVLASICLLQAAYPTLLGWGIVVAIYSIALAVYFYGAIAGLIELTHGGEATDLTTVVLIVVVLLAMDVALVRHRPTHYPQSS